MKRFIGLLLACLLMICSCSTHAYAYVEEYTYQGYTYDDMEHLQIKLQEIENAMKAAHDMATAARNLGYSEIHNVIQLAKDEYNTYDAEYQEYMDIYNTIHDKWEMKRDEYPDATLIWEILRQAGYSNYICAGIVGNIMTEVGGDTLNIQPQLQTNEYYGICQWSSYYPDVWGLSVEKQCDFLLATIKKEFKDFGYLYERGMNYESYRLMTDCRDVALCFAKVYERCSSKTYRARQDNAVVAYNYFVS